MIEDSVGRRSVLRNAGMAAGGVALGGVALASPASAGDSGGVGHLSGSWRVQVHNDDGSETVSVLSFAAGQVCVVHDISPAGPPFTGAWRPGRRGSFRATVLTGFPGDDGPGSSGPVIELRLAGAARHGRLSGSFTFTVTDPAGNEVGTGSGTFDGERIEA
ncbi:hypothetical protein [Nocardioides sp. GXQ0305]|uniref:hypothetical protein n=1 Tax=Nocardioides sp. GXQ0305 TaxID=3423912 RepID=UPI003D7D73FD